ncbi:MAG: carboxypeptidase regulatory-like domain-containing protein [Acidobacteria bacterium]|nr:carboxypeptidase regulatory-like domain-containing protein [Acidobacteriota bacterium]
MRTTRLLFLFVLLAAILAPLRAQDVTAKLNGAVKDATNASVPNATVTLTSAATGVTRSVQTNSDGYFAFADLHIGTYTLTVESKGFKKYQQAEVNLTAGQIRSMGELRLAVGDVAETVTVEATAVAVELGSGEKSGVITGQDLENTAIRGRDYLDMLRLLPGVVDESDGREAPGPDGIRSLYINGARENQKNITIDGVTSMDSGSNSTTHTAPTLSTIAEVKVLTSAYQAEYGRAVGGTLIVTTRGGGRQYHGSGFWTHRHEQFNANDYFNNQRGVRKTPYRFNLQGWNLNGPVLWKNRREAKLFFFVSQEYTRQKINYPLRQVRMPTLLERTGDFSQTLDVNQRALVVYDPYSNPVTPLPGNIMPATMINKTGQSILNMLPKPNYTDPVASRAVQWNYLSSLSGSYPRRQDMFRIDWTPDNKLQIYGRYTQDADEQHPPYSVWINGGYNFELTALTFRQPGKGLVLAATRALSPTWYSETRLGYSMNRLTSSPDEPDKISKDKLGLSIPQWRPDLNPMGLIPNVTFGTPGTAPNMSLNNALPYKNVNHIFSATQNFSKIHKTHTIRMGVYVERTRKDQIQGTPTRGTITFNDDANNPYRTRYGFASALAGIMTSYQEATSKPYGLYRFTNLEWYIQDNWKVSRRLALDYGIRFYHDRPQEEVRSQTSAFVPGFYDPKNAPTLITSARNSANVRIGIDPVTGRTFNAAFVGTFAPGHGDPSMVMVTGGTRGFPNSMYTTPGLMIGPRVGFAYDLLGNGRLALRGGAGVFFDRVQGNPTMNMVSNPPTSFSPTLYYSTFDELAASANSALLAPSTISHSLYGKGTMPQSYQYTLGFQRMFGRATFAEVAYVGNFGRHQLWQRNIDPVPIGAQFPNLNPQNRDATTGQTFNANFLRPYTGYGDILNYDFASTSNYNSVQASFRTQTRRGFMIRGSYTFAKALGSAGSDTTSVTPFFEPRKFNYGRLSYSRDHVLAIMPSFSVPKEWLPNQAVLRTVMKGWSVFATGQMSSGQPFRPGFGTVDGMNMTGTPSQGATMWWVGPSGCPDPNNCTLAQQFARPGMPRVAGTIETPYWGNLGVNTFNRPGINNWDMRLQRRFQLFSERRWMDVRLETFNTFNHTQFSAIDATARFDAAGSQINALFLQPTASRRPRFLSLAVQVNF